MKARACVIPVFVPNLGCPHQCLFCDQRQISGQKLTPDRQLVLDTAAPPPGLALPARGRELAFYGGSFTTIPLSLQEELLGAADEAYHLGWIDSLRLSTRPDAIDLPTLQRLKRHGVTTIELGAQSMDDRVLKLSGRGHSAMDTVRAAKLVQAEGFHLILQMMTGLPGDSGPESMDTAEKLCALRPDGVRIYPTVILKDTALFHLWKRGAYREHGVEEAVELCARIVPLFAAAGIPVIRLGLNPSDELSGGLAVGGAYHPALGELVYSRIWRNRAEALLRQVPPGSRVCIAVGEKRLSQMIGQHRENLVWLREHCLLSELKILPEIGIGDEIRILSPATPDTAQNE